MQTLSARKRGSAMIPLVVTWANRTILPAFWQDKQREGKQFFKERITLTKRKKEYAIGCLMISTTAMVIEIMTMEQYLRKVGHAMISKCFTWRWKCGKKMQSPIRSCYAVSPFWFSLTPTVHCTLQFFSLFTHENYVAHLCFLCFVLSPNRKTILGDSLLFRLRRYTYHLVFILYRSKLSVQVWLKGPTICSGCQTQGRLPTCEE